MFMVESRSLPNILRDKAKYGVIAGSMLGILFLYDFLIFLLQKIINQTKITEMYTLALFSSKTKSF